MPRAEAGTVGETQLLLSAASWLGWKIATEQVINKQYVCERIHAYIKKQDGGTSTPIWAGWAKEGKIPGLCEKSPLSLVC